MEYNVQKINFANHKYIFSSYYSFLLSGDSYLGLAVCYRLGKSTVHKIISQTCKAIWIKMQPEFMPKPTERDWQRIEEGFRKRWHFPNCIGALDGKHVSIRSAPNSGSLFFNYKGYFFLVLLALDDANYRFIYVDIGEYGSNADSNVFQYSNFGKKYMNERLNIPGLKHLPNYQQEGPLPHVIVADEAFPLLHTLMRPYPRNRESTIPCDECIFNYRLSRARMVVEGAFGILAQRWRVFDRRLPLSTDNADKVIQAAVCLHNYLTEDKDLSKIVSELNPEGCQYGDGSVVLWIPRLSGYQSWEDAMGVRDIFKGYFNSPQGTLSWQESRISYRNV